MLAVPSLIGSSVVGKSYSGLLKVFPGYNASGGNAISIVPLPAAL